MAKAEIYKTKHGLQFDEWMAKKQADVRAGMIIHTYDIAKKARRVLARHKHDGHARIVTGADSNGVDRFVALDDTRGLMAAKSIEFGRRGDTIDVNGKPVSAMDPVAPLRIALGRGVTPYKSWGGGRERA